MTKFLIYPAVDIKDGKCVRLTHGKENHMTIYEDDPIKQVNFFSKNGFKWVHIVDLNAAFGKRDNKKIILQILKSFNAHCLDDFLTKYRVRENSLQSNRLRNFFWIWKINKQFNNLNLIQNFFSLLFISLNSLKKYGFKRL